MLLILLAYLGGVLTIVSPCILPVLPFVFSRAGESFLRSGLPLLVGMVASFALVASLAAVGGGWVVAANQYGRWLALGLVALFALTLLWPGLADRLTRPLVSAGSRLSERAQSGGRLSGAGGSFVLGIATGLLWAPCAGPILGLILAGAALQGPGAATSLMLLAYAAGAATSMAAALLLGGRVFAAMKRSLGTGQWLRRGLGGAMLAAVVAIGLGLDTGLLARLSLASTGGLEQRLVARLAGSGSDGSAMLPAEGPAPPLDGAVQWLNSPPLAIDGLRGKVVLIDFWTYSCINCLRTLPHVKAWAAKYQDKGLVVVGVHTPEFAFERDLGNVSKAVKDLGITYPVAVDNDYAIWRAYNNRYWPAHYLIDAQGRIRHFTYGEGNDDKTERVLQMLLREAGATDLDSKLTAVSAEGVQEASDFSLVRSHETYIGYARAEHFASAPAMLRDRPASYEPPTQPALNQWGLGGEWQVGAEQATLVGSGGRIVYRFQARDLHLVLGPGPDGRPVRFRVLIDGLAPGAASGLDVAADGSGVVTGQRLYQLIRQSGRIQERTFTIEFLDPGVSAYAFTFG